MLFNGPGKYDAQCTLVREQVKADSVLLVVFNGTQGDGFAVQAGAEVLIAMPKILRNIAEQIEQQVQAGPQH